MIVAMSCVWYSLFSHIQVTLRSAADRVIVKAAPQLDPVETLMKSIRDRGGKTADDKPDRLVTINLPCVHSGKVGNYPFSLLSDNCDA